VKPPTFRTPFVIPLLTLATVAPLWSQTSSVSGPPMTVSAEIARTLITTLTADLKKLVVAQESYFSNHNAYGKVLSSGNPQQVVIEPAPGVTLTLTYVTTNSWAGRATHEWLPGRSCVITVGAVPDSRIPRTTDQRLAPREEGRPICDRP
jgi:hypothetical protein